jgi:ankyrin repeat protein
LIEQGIKIDAIDADDWTPLHYACAKGHLEIVKLIEIKENIYFDSLIQMKTKTKATCLHLAVQNGDMQLVEYIIKKFTNDTLKICINEQTEPFGTPLHIAGRSSTGIEIESDLDQILILNFLFF